MARDAAGEVAGFSAVCELTDAPARLFDRDPVAAVWRADLRAHPLARGERALLVRFMCGARGGERPAPDVAPLFLDLKRSYLALRPALRRVYTCAHDPAMAATVEPLGFAALDGEPRLDGVPYRCLCNDFGPGSVDGWLTRLAARDVLAGSVPLLDPDERRLVLDGRPIALTPLEFRVLWMLHQRSGTVVRRAALIEEVWGTGWDGEGNAARLGDQGRAAQARRARRSTRDGARDRLPAAPAGLNASAGERTTAWPCTRGQACGHARSARLASASARRRADRGLRTLPGGRLSSVELRDLLPPGRARAAQTCPADRAGG